MEALDFIAMSIGNYIDTGNYFLLTQPMATLADYFDRFGHHEAAATLSGYATTSFATNYLPEAETTITHLREALGDDKYQSLADRGAAMTPAAIAKYAMEQINQVRAELESLAGEPQ
jgi:hypothetical protein